MAAHLPDDDPTHALDDFVRRIGPVAAAGGRADVDLSGLQRRLHADRPSAAASPKGGTLRSGQTWVSDDVVDGVNVVLPTVRQPATVNPAALDDSLRQASQSVQGQWQDEERTLRQPGWQPDGRNLRPPALRRAAHPRRLTAWQPGSWIAAACHAIDAATEIDNSPQHPTTVEAHAPQHLLLLWPPQRLDAPLLGRWPQQAWLSALSADAAADAVLDSLPADARLWLMPQAGGVDWALAAEIVLHHQAGLRPFQTTGLRRFIDRQREADFASLNADYRPSTPTGPALRQAAPQP